jgi:L-asparaginase II
VVVAPDGSMVESWGDAEHVIFPRSSNKPAQATALVRLGLDLPPHLLALAASSHSGEDFHLEGARAILATAGLDASSLQTPPDFPLDEQERDAWVREGRAQEPIAMNCSGKHSAMLATCVINGWSLDDYRDPQHPLQQSIQQEIESLAGEPVAHVGVDGCGAPVLSLSVVGLARSLSRSMTADVDAPERRVLTAMAAHPEYVGGTRRDVTDLMRAVPGLVAKDGAEGVFVAALPNGTAVALKIEDGSDRARQVAMAAILVRHGVDRGALASLLEIPMLGGGEPVGRVTSPIV